MLRGCLLLVLLPCVVPSSTGINEESSQTIQVVILIAGTDEFGGHVTGMFQTILTETITVHVLPNIPPAASIAVVWGHADKTENTFSIVSNMTNNRSESYSKLSEFLKTFPRSPTSPLSGISGSVTYCVQNVFDSKNVFTTKVLVVLSHQAIINQEIYDFLEDDNRDRINLFTFILFPWPQQSCEEVDKYIRNIHKIIVYSGSAVQTFCSKRTEKFGEINEAFSKFTSAIIHEDQLLTFERYNLLEDYQTMEKPEKVLEKSPSYTWLWIVGILMGCVVLCGLPFMSWWIVSADMRRRRQRQPLGLYAMTTTTVLSGHSEELWGLMLRTAFPTRKNSNPTSSLFHTAPESQSSPARHPSVSIHGNSTRSSKSKPVPSYV